MSFARDRSDTNFVLRFSDCIFAVPSGRLAMSRGFVNIFSLLLLDYVPFALQNSICNISVWYDFLFTFHEQIKHCITLSMFSTI